MPRQSTQPGLCPLMLSVTLAPQASWIRPVHHSPRKGALLWNTPRSHRQPNTFQTLASHERSVIKDKACSWQARIPSLHELLKDLRQITLVVDYPSSLLPARHNRELSIIFTIGKLKETALRNHIWLTSNRAELSFNLVTASGRWTPRKYVCSFCILHGRFKLPLFGWQFL